MNQNNEIASPAHVPTSPADQSPVLQLRPKGLSPETGDLVALIGTVLFLVAMPLLIAARFWLHLYGLQGHAPIGPRSLIGYALLLLAYGPNTALGRRLKARWLTHRAAKRYPGAVPTPIASASDGLVRIQGSGQLLEALVTPGGVLALAYRDRVLRTISGSICVRDGSGMNAVICSEWVEIGGDVQFSGESIVPDGAQIEVTGYAQRVAVPEVANRAFRSVPSVLEFIGTRDNPIVIRVVAAPKEARC